MSGQSQNIIQIISFLTESLSDSISELVLLAIVYQEKNAPVPPNMPNAVNLVLEASNNFVKVGHSIAQRGFQNFPEMRTKIINASNEVAESTIMLSKTPFQSTDIKLIWDTLVQGCKALGSSSVQLLECVYTAQFERIMKSYQNTKENFEKITFDDIPENAQNFVTCLQNANQTAVDTANFIRHHGEAQESPLMREQLINGADNVLSKTYGINESMTLIDIANKFLGDYRNEEKKKELTSFIETLKQDMATLIEHLQKAFQTVSTEVEILSQIGTANELSDLRYIVEAGIKHSNLRREMLEASRNGDTERLQRLRKQLQEHSREIFEAARNQESSARKLMMGYADEMEELLPQQMELAVALSLDPENEELLEKLADAEEEMQEYADSIAGPLAELAQDISEELEDLEELSEAVHSGDKKKVVTAAKKLQKGKAKIAKQVRERSQKLTDISRRERLENAADRLEELVSQEIQTAQEILAHPDDKNLQAKLEEINDDILEVLEELEPLGTVGRTRELMAEVLQLKGTSDKAAKGKQLKKTAAKLSKRVRAEAKYGAVATRKQMENCLQELDDLLEQHIEATEELQQDPLSTPKAQRVSELENEIHDVLEEIAGPQSLTREATELLDDVRTQALAKDREHLEQTVKRVGKTKAKIVAKARAEARKTADPTRRQQLETALHDLDQMLPQAFALSTQLANLTPSEEPTATSTKTEQLLEQLDDLNERIEERLLEIASPDAVLPYFESGLELQLDELELSAVSGAAPATAKVATRLKKTGARLQAAVKTRATSIPDPQRQQAVLHDLGRLNTAMEKLLDLASRVGTESKNSNTEKTQVSTELLEELDDANDEVRRLVAAVGQPESRQLAHQEGELLAQLVNTALGGKTSSSLPTSAAAPEVQLMTLNNRLVHVLRHEARSAAPSREQQLLTCASQLGSLVPLVARLASSPSSASSDLPAQLTEAHEQAQLFLTELTATGETSINSLSQTHHTEVNKLETISRAGDTQGVAVFGRKLKKSTTRICKQARQAASSTRVSPLRATEVRSAAEELGRLVEQQLELAQTLARNPNDTEVAHQLHLTNQLSEDAVHQITFSMSLGQLIAQHEDHLDTARLQAQLHHAQPAALTQRRLGKTASRIAARVRAEAQNIAANEPRKQALLENAVKLETLATTHQKLLQAACQASASPQALQALIDNEEQMRTTLSQLGDQQDLELLSDGFVVQVARFLGTANPKEKETAQRQILALQPKLQKAVREENQGALPIHIKLTEEALERLIKNYQSSKLNPPTDVDEFIQHMVRYTEQLNQDNMVQAMEQIRQTAENFRRTVASGDSKAIASAAREVFETGRALSPAVRDNKKLLSSPQQHQQVTDALNLLKASLGQLALQGVRSGLAGNNSNSDLAMTFSCAVERVGRLTRTVAWAFQPPFETRLNDLATQEGALLARASSSASGLPQQTGALNARVVAKGRVAALLVSGAARQHNIDQSAQQLEKALEAAENAEGPDQQAPLVSAVSTQLTHLISQTVAAPVALAHAARRIAVQVQACAREQDGPALRTESVRLSDLMTDFVDQTLKFNQKNSSAAVPASVSEVALLNTRILQHVLALVQNPASSSELQTDLKRLDEVLDEAVQDLRPPAAQSERSSHAILKKKRTNPSLVTLGSPTASPTNNNNNNTGSRRPPLFGTQSTTPKPSSSGTQGPAPLVQALEALEKAATAPVDPNALRRAVHQLGVQVAKCQLQNKLHAAGLLFTTANATVQAKELPKVVDDVNKLSSQYSEVISCVNDTVSRLTAEEQGPIYTPATTLAQKTNDIVSVAKEVLGSEAKGPQNFQQLYTSMLQLHAQISTAAGYPSAVPLTPEQEKALSIAGQLPTKPPIADPPTTAQQAIQAVRSTLALFMAADAPESNLTADPAPSSSTNTPKASNTPTASAQPVQSSAPSSDPEAQGRIFIEEIKELRSQLEQVSLKETSQPVVTEKELVDACEELLRPKEPAKTASPAVAPRKTPKKGLSQKKIKEGETFEENIHHIADFVREESGQASGPQSDETFDLSSIPGICNKIAAILTQLASNSKNRQALIQNGKEISNLSITLDKMVREKAKSAPKTLQDQMIRSSEAIRNYSTQLKILAAVVAASRDTQSDLRFIQMARNFAYSISQVLSAEAQFKIHHK